MADQLIPLAGPAPVQPQQVIGYPDLDKPGRITLKLRAKPIPPEKELELTSLFTGSIRTRQHLTHDEVEQLTGTDPSDLAALEAYFKPLGIKLAEKNGLTRKVTFEGDLAGIQNAFNTDLAVVQEGARGVALSNLKQFELPAPVANLVESVEPFTVPVRKESRLPIRRLSDKGLMRGVPLPVGYPPKVLAQAYDFPAATGKGQTIGFIELGGKLNPADYEQFCQEQGIKPAKIIEVGTPPIISDPNTAFLDNLEVSLDLEIGVAIAGEATLVIYYGNTIAEAMRAVVSDRANNPSVVSISWAGSEFNYTPQEVQEMNFLFYQAALLGITVVAASADYGALNSRPFPNVSLPSSNPLVLACGGTDVTITNGQISSEVVWNELIGNVFTGSGGGYSSLYPMPAFQQAAIGYYPFQKAATRGVPDVAANASQAHGYQVVFGGKSTVIYGTSAATPLVAALIALMNEKLGYRLGYINPHLYALAGTNVFRQITQGNNQVYAAAPYWNPCTGLGSLVGKALLDQLSKL